MYYDLSFNADDLEPFAARERSAAATTLGYSVVATNTTALDRLTAKDRYFGFHRRGPSGAGLSFLMGQLLPKGHDTNEAYTR